MAQGKARSSSATATPLTRNRDLSDGLAGAVEAPQCSGAPVRGDGRGPGGHAGGHLPLEPRGGRRPGEVYARVHLLPPFSLETGGDVLVTPARRQHEGASQDPDVLVCESVDARIQVTEHGGEYGGGGVTISSSRICAPYAATDPRRPGRG